MKKFFARNGELLFIFFIVVVIMAGIVLYFFSQPNTIEHNNGTVQNENRANTEGANQKEKEEVTLRDGRVIKIGDTIQMIAPTYNGAPSTIDGTVQKMYPESKRALLLVGDGLVVELTYRYVIELKATNVTTGVVNSTDGSNSIGSNAATDTDGQSAMSKSFTDTVRGVITLNNRGAEMVHFIEDLDHPNWVGSYRATEFDATNSYTDSKIYNVLQDDPATVPEDIRQFYQKYAPNTAR